MIFVGHWSCCMSNVKSGYDIGLKGTSWSPWSQCMFLDEVFNGQ